MARMAKCTRYTLLYHADSSVWYACALTLQYCNHTQGRHVKTGQLAAIKIMEVTEVWTVVQRAQHVWWW